MSHVEEAWEDRLIVGEMFLRASGQMQPEPTRARICSTSSSLTLESCPKSTRRASVRICCTGNLVTLRLSNGCFLNTLPGFEVLTVEDGVAFPLSLSKHFHSRDINDKFIIPVHNQTGLSLYIADISIHR